MHGESHTYKKSMYGPGSVVSIDASAESVDELKMILQKVGVTLPSGEPKGDDEPKSCGCGQDPCITYGTPKEKEPKVIAIDVDGEQDGDSAMQFPKTDVNPDASMTTDKEVLNNILRDRLKDYLRNSK
jgi:hypothetical protein|tara:strand:+ start:27369 stop:27752 length:384 start_codon:yes stop_codon:yes gene_type:complete